jgi:hypothetical protein
MFEGKPLAIKFNLSGAKPLDPISVVEGAKFCHLEVLLLKRNKSRMGCIIPPC